MPIEVLMPALSPTMEKGNLAKWLKKEGDKVKSGDVIAEIETDKATMEVEAVDEGTLGKILVPEGTNDVAVNTPIAMILARARTPPRSRTARSPRALQRPSREPRAEQEGAESAHAGRAEKPAARSARQPAQPKSAVAAPPSPRRSPSPTCRTAPRWSP